MDQQDKAKILVVDDVPEKLLAIEVMLEPLGQEVVSVTSGADALRRLLHEDFALILLDVNMPGMDGFETAKRIRTVSTTYIVMLSARTEEIDALQGLEAGADDYVAKPFRPRELRARIDAMLRRPRHHVGLPAAAERSAPAPAVASWVEHNGVRLNAEMRIVTVDGTDLELTRSEFDILADLLAAGRRVRGKSELALMLRGEQYTGVEYVSDSDARAIEVHVANLRRKLGESPASPRWIETVRGVGYRLTAS
jgi:DNA-binding response OmpR family regulator